MVEQTFPSAVKVASRDQHHGDTAAADTHENSHTAEAGEVRSAWAEISVRGVIVVGLDRSVDRIDGTHVLERKQRLRVSVSWFGVF
jgi:hypothetical protein